MKKIYLIVFCLISFASVKAQYIDIQNATFRSYLKNKFPSCFNASGQMDTTCNAIVYADSLDLSNNYFLPNYQSVPSEIYYFKHLKYLNLRYISGYVGGSAIGSYSGHQFEGIINFPKTLKYLDISNNQFQTWYENEDIYGHLTYSKGTLFSKFPDSLETLIADNLLFIENYYYYSYTYSPSTLKDSLPSLPNSLKTLKFSSTYVDKGFNNSGSTVRFKTNQLPPNLNTLEINTSDKYYFNHIVPYTSLPSTLNNFSCNCDSADIRRLFSSSLLPNLDTLRLTSWGKVEYLPINMKYAQINYACLNKLKHYVLDSLKYLDFNNTSSEVIDIQASYLTDFRCKNSDYLKTLRLASDSMKSLDFSDNKCYKLDSIFLTNNNLITFNCSNNDSIKYLSLNLNNLDTLLCKNNSINKISNLPNTIRYINCISNKLTTLPNVPTSLNYFNCRNNLFAILPALFNSIQYLDCSNMGINPTSNTKLNTITNLPNSLQYVNCSNNSLVYLPPVSTAATKILCQNNLLHALPALPNTLRYLDCSNNYFLTTMPTLSSVLDTLQCSINNITRLPSLPASLKYLDCSKNAMNYLPELPDNLSYLHCWNNDFYCLPKLPSALSEFWVSTLHIACMPNTVSCPVTEVHDNYSSGYYNAILNPAPPICNPASNANQCKFKPVMEGTVYYDINSNGIKDANEYYSKNVKVQLSNGTYTFTDTKGHYELTADSLGDYTVRINAPQYYIAIADTFHYTFTQYNALETELVALQPLQSKDSVTVKITPWQNCARPASSLDYIINYENVGTTNLSPIVTFNYDSALLIYVKSSNNFVTNNGTVLTLNISSFAVGQTGGFTASFVVKSTDTLGSIINANVAIVGGSCTAVDTVHSKVKSSFDPNDKNATPVLTPLQVALGKDIDYTIRFQNTGTDTAFNVVITDTLDNQLQHNTMQLVGSSHNCKTTVKDGVAVFEFLKINLPDSNTNKLKSHGFVNFKIKPNSSLTNGAIVPNNAAIYFDYNTPVNTNTALTQINATGIVTPVRFAMYDVRCTMCEPAGVEKQITNYWTTATEINTSHFNIQRSENGKEFKTVGTIAAKGIGEYKFADKLTPTHLPLTIYYRLQAMDKDGQTSYSEIKQIRLNQLTNKLINVFPNPSRDYLTIESKGVKKLVITDCFGRTVMQLNNITEHKTINTKQWNKGLYIVSFDNGEKVKVVKE